MEENARHIARAIEHKVDHLSVVYSNKAGTTETGAGHWVKVPDDWFYGRKFSECLRLHSGTIMLQIQADAASDSWHEVIDRCRQAYSLYDDLGVWAPDIDFTPWDMDRVKIARIPGTSFAAVLQTDGIVWSLSEPVIERMRRFDYEQNNLGWGIDWAAICYAFTHDLLVLRDTSICVTHPQGTSYDKPIASKQQTAFLSQMTLQEKIMYDAVRLSIAFKQSLLPTV